MHDLVFEKWYSPEKDKTWTKIEMGKKIGPWLPRGKMFLATTSAATLLLMWYILARRSVWQQWSDWEAELWIRELKGWVSKASRVLKVNVKILAFTLSKAGSLWWIWDKGKTLLVDAGEGPEMDGKHGRAHYDWASSLIALCGLLYSTQGT